MTIAKAPQKKKPLSPFHKKLMRAAIGAAAVSALALAWDSIEPLELLEDRTLDFRYMHFNREKKASPKVMFIDIDDQSLKALAPSYGRWPWPRSIHRSMIEFVSQGEPAGIFFDVLFTEEQLGTDDDAKLAEITEMTGFVHHAMQLQPAAGLDEAAEAKRDSTGALMLPDGFAEKYAVSWDGAAPDRFLTSLRKDKDYNIPNPTLLAKAPSVMLVTVRKDPDGIYRRSPIAVLYGDHWYPSLALKAVQSTLKEPKLKTEGRKVVVSGLNAEGKPVSYKVPLTDKGYMRLHYYQPKDAKGQEAFEVIPYSAVMDSARRFMNNEYEKTSDLKLNPEDIKGKVVIIGASASGLEDLKATPVSPSYPGPFLHGTAISNILEQDFLKSMPKAANIAVAIAMIVAIYLCVFLTSHIALKTVVPLAALAGFSGVSIYLFQSQSLWLELARPIGLGLLALIDGFAYMIFVEGKDKKKLKETLTKYIPPAMAEQMIASGVDPRAEVGHRQELSILFSDIRGFTTLSEKMQAEVLVGILNEYLGRMTDIVFKHKGTLDKFIGDAVMAFWGAPVNDPEHAKNAVACALEMSVALKELNKGWVAQGYSELAIGVGINTGEAIVGNIGSEKRLDYTIIGDNVNLGSRLEGLTKQYGLELLISGRTEEMIRDSMVCRPLDFVRVKGKSEHVRIYEPLGLVSSPDAQKHQELARKTSEALAAYQKGDFGKAKDLYAEIDRTRPGGDALSRAFVERCDDLIAEPPESWDGIYTSKSK